MRISMQVIFNIDGKHSSSRQSAIALGTFDGIHLGHRELIRHLNEQKKLGLTTIVYTFLSHPMSRLAPGSTPDQIMLLKEKIIAFSRLGIDTLVLNPFSDEFLHQSHEEFLQRLVSSYNVKTLIVGFNFRFGFKGQGDTGYLEEASRRYGFDLICVPPVKLDGRIVSSTLVRSLVAEGYVEDAAHALGMPYTIAGKVIKGFGRGTLLGFPTANIARPMQKVIPKPGVYAVICKVEGNFYRGVANVGFNPTFEGNSLSIETHLVDFKGSLYGKRMRVYFMKRIRDEVKFDSPEELKDQIKADVTKANNLIYKTHLLW